jgi:phage tail-like protein
MPMVREDPVASFRFMVECDNLGAAFFTECSGLKVEVDVYTYKEGGLNDYEHKLPGRRKWSNIVLQRGITSSLEMWDWYQQVIAGEPDQRRNLSIILNSSEGEPVMRWDVEDAFPVSWEGPAMKSDGNTVTIEKLEIAHCGFVVIN